jgi:hypothetical protein
MSFHGQRILDALALRPELQFEVWQHLRNFKYAGPWTPGPDGEQHRLDRDRNILASVWPDTVHGVPYKWRVVAGGVSVEGTADLIEEAKEHCDMHLSDDRVAFIDDPAVWNGAENPPSPWQRQETGVWVRVEGTSIVATIRHSTLFHNGDMWGWILTDETAAGTTRTLELALAAAESALK